MGAVRPHLPDVAVTVADPHILQPVAVEPDGGRRAGELEGQVAGGKKQELFNKVLPILRKFFQSIYLGLNAIIIY